MYHFSSGLSNQKNEKFLECFWALLVLGFVLGKISPKFGKLLVGFFWICRDKLGSVEKNVNVAFQSVNFSKSSNGKFMLELL